jgi:hypothetical protein
MGPHRLTAVTTIPGFPKKWISLLQVVLLARYETAIIDRMPYDPPTLQHDYCVRAQARI